MFKKIFFSTLVAGVAQVVSPVVMAGDVVTNSALGNKAASTQIASSVSVVDSRLEITNARVREPIPGRMMSAAFLTITNNGSVARNLVSVSADWAGLIEIHTHLHEDGVMKMRQLERLEIPAGESVVLQPGGLHLMLFKLQLPLADLLPMELCFSNGECIDTTATLFSPM